MGDGAIAEFGSVVDAMACAVGVQKGVEERQADVPAEHRIVFRIGINLGDVVVEGDDLLGDGVNVAARLEQLCEPGGVLVSGTAYDQLQGKLDLTLDFVGEQRVKNISRPVRTYRVRLDGSRRSLRLHARRFRRWAAAGAKADPMEFTIPTVAGGCEMPCSYLFLSGEVLSDERALPPLPPRQGPSGDQGHPDERGRGLYLVPASPLA
jgi:hypothetical protein